MTYMIFDNENAIDTFDDLDSARRAVSVLVDRDPSAVCDLALLTFDEDGNAVGEVEVAADIVPAAARRMTLSSAIYEWVQVTAETFVPSTSWPRITPASPVAPVAANMAAPARVA